MSAELDWELNAFSSVCDMVVQDSSRTYPDFANGQMLAVAVRAIKHTVRANGEAIAHLMGQIATKVPKMVQGQRGKTRFSHRIFRTDTYSFAARIINARRKKAGQPMIWGDELDAAARGLIARRLRSVGFIKSGWIWAIRKLSKTVGYSVSNYEGAARPSGQPKGDAIPAQGGLAVLSGDISATIINTALLAAGKYSRGNPLPIAEAGLQAALNETSADMLDHWATKLQPILDKYSAK